MATVESGFLIFWAVESLLFVVGVVVYMKFK